MKKRFCDFTAEELKELLKEHTKDSFRAKQLLEWVYAKFKLDFEYMSNIPKELKANLASQISLSTIKLKRKVASQDQETFKFLWQLEDGALVESVLILSAARKTVCVSSQVGCPGRCAFCASGKLGWIRNLQCAEIIEQIIGIENLMGFSVSHIVFMGMGEPLENWNEVYKAIKILNHPEMFKISQRRITLSTVGIIKGINELIKTDLKINLVLSLHAPNQVIRERLIPYARKNPLPELLDVLEQYFQATKREITYEYILISEVNDKPEQAVELSRLLKNKLCTVNLIPYNPIEGVNFKKPDKFAIQKFRQILTQNRINNTCRYTKGDDIQAACGQLALNQIEE